MDFKDTVFLPKTSFSMRANLAQREPEILAHWESIHLYQKLREQSHGAPKFVLHDGPPFANGNIHLGTTLNKVLKDVIVRMKQMTGHDAPYIPGWDCHGLPIEWKIEEKYRKKGQDKDEISPVDFRKECREFASHWIDIQKAEFKRIGVIGDWDNPYITMSNEAEAEIFKELTKFVMDGQFYKGFRPVMWSVIEKTSLAEAEVEYEDKESNSVYIGFPVQQTSHDLLKDAKIVIWTTTPWTIPANRAVAYGENVAYSALKANGQTYIVADDLADRFAEACEFDVENLGVVTADMLKDTVLVHPLKSLGYEFDIPLLPGNHVTTEQGTGFVHTAPSHGIEDFELGKQYGLEVPETVTAAGLYTKAVPGFEGTHVFKADPMIIEALTQQGHLLAHGKIKHSYPHSWRSKAPLIYRAVPQWFIKFEGSPLRDRALAAIEKTRWLPATGKNRIKAMVEGRPDWCISRQRVWGVPIALFVHKETGEILKDQAVMDRIYQAFTAHGSDCWFNDDLQHFMGNDHNAEDYDAVYDILDVWFESGSTHRYVLEKRPELTWPADLYLEGSDQHRGWFQSSLLVATGHGDEAPYKTVLTHGFIVDDKGKKMSKSLGNTLSIPDMIKQFGVDIIRLWLVSTDYTEDIRVSNDILKQHAETYRKLRNCWRYILGNLDGFTEAEKIDYAEMPELEKWVLHRLSELHTQFEAMQESYDLNRFYAALHQFCALDLSAFYFDIRKDALYCDASNSSKRRAARTVLDILFTQLTHWFAPVLCFSAEDAYFSRYQDAEAQGKSIHLEQIPVPDKMWHKPELTEKWQKLRDVRAVITGAIEVERAAKKIGSSLQAHPHLYVAELDQLEDIDLAELTISSQVTISKTKLENAFTLDRDDIQVKIELAEGGKCARCWRVLPEVETHDHGLCARCDSVVVTEMDRQCIKH